MNAENLNKLYEKIANCLEMGLEFEEIAAVTKRTVEEIQQIEGSEEFKAFKTQIALDNYEEEALVSDAWSAIEQRSLQIVGQKLQTTRDADFALKAAVLANKAIRRGKQQGTSPIVVNGDVRAALNLPVAFVQKIQAGQLNVGTPQTEKKQIDMNKVSDVERVLGVAKDTLDEEVGEIFSSAMRVLAPAE